MKKQPTTAPTKTADARIEALKEFGRKAGVPWQPHIARPTWEHTIGPIYTSASNAMRATNYSGAALLATTGHTNVNTD